MNKTQREEWDKGVEYARNFSMGYLASSIQEAIVEMDVYVRKLERELQALKNKKTMAALLMKKA